MTRGQLQDLAETILALSPADSATLAALVHAGWHSPIRPVPAPPPGAIRPLPQAMPGFVGPSPDWRFTVNDPVE